ncbi:MAG: MarR family winged helix-turn-helix transcriptional regulator [Micropepsaceae bacterium]
MAKSFELASSTSHLLRRAIQLALDLYEEELEAGGLTVRQLTVLHAVDQNDEATLTQTKLVELTSIDRSTLADIIDRIEKRELIVRKRVEEDQRANSVKITAIGRRALKGAQPAMQRAEIAFLETLPARNRAEFLKSLNLLAQASEDRKKLNGAKKPRERR